MSLTVEESKGKVELIPAGVHVAVCQALIDIGEQYSEKFDKWNRKVLIIWQLPNVKGTDKEGNEFTRKISKEYTAILGEKTNLEKDLNAWRGKPFTAEEKAGFDLRKILGVGCQIQIIHKEREKGTYSEISGIMALPSGMVVNPTEDVYCFDIDDKETWANYSKIPEWIQEKIKRSQGYEDSELKVSIENNNAIPDEKGFITVDDESQRPF